MSTGPGVSEDEIEDDPEIEDGGEPAADPDPEEMGQEALQKAIETVDDADDDPVSIAKAEGEAVQQFAKDMAEAALNGLRDSNMSRLANSLNDVCRNTTKTGIKNDIEDAVQASLESGTTGTPINGYLLQNVERVERVRSTDANQDALYQWVIDDPEAGEFRIETGPDPSVDNHFQWKSLRFAIYDAGGIWPADPIPALQSKKAWESFIVGQIDEKGVDVDQEGIRTLAVQSLQNHIARSVAYPTIEDMIRYSGVRIDDDPEDGDPTGIWVRSQEIANICDDCAVETRGLQVELDARGYTADRVSGVSERASVDDAMISYWVLDAEIADPAEYEPDPEGAVERTERMMREDRESAELDDDDEEEAAEIDLVETIGGNDGDEENRDQEMTVEAATDGGDTDG